MTITIIIVVCFIVSLLLVMIEYRLMSYLGAQHVGEDVLLLLRADDREAEREEHQRPRRDAPDPALLGGAEHLAEADLSCAIHAHAHAQANV